MSKFARVCMWIVIAVVTVLVVRILWALVKAIYHAIKHHQAKKAIKPAIS